MRCSPAGRLFEGLGGCSGPIKTAGSILISLGLTVVSFVQVRRCPQWTAVGSGASESNRASLNPGPQTRKRVRANLRGFKSRRHRQSEREVPVLSISQRLRGERNDQVIENMPPGTIGVEAVGKVTEDDYRNVLVPDVSAALERGDVRLLYVLGKDFDSYSAGALWADTKLLAGNRKAWKKVAIVSDADWLENSIKAFGWLMPGRSRSSRPTRSTMPKNGWLGWTTTMTTTDRPRQWL